jgi:hypothetical protein
MDLGLIARGFGSCRRYPPQVNVVIRAAGAFDELHKWPVTQAGQWCGEGQMKVEVVS